MNQETTFSEPVPPIDELKAAGAGAIAVEAAEHAKDMEYARKDPDQSAIGIINDYDKERTVELDQAQNEAIATKSERVAQIRADLEARRKEPKFMGPDGRFVSVDEIKEQNEAVNDGALDRR